MPKRARISVADIIHCSVIATAEHQESLGDPNTLVDALQGPYFTRWAQYRRINLVREQVGLVDDRADLDTVDDLPQRTRGGRVPRSNWRLQRPFPSACNPRKQSVWCQYECGGIYVEKMKDVVVYLARDGEDVVAIVLYAYALRADPLLSPDAADGHDVSSYRL